MGKGCSFPKGPPWGPSERVRKVQIGGKDAPPTCARGRSCEPATGGGFPCTDFEVRCRAGETGPRGVRPGSALGVMEQRTGVDDLPHTSRSAALLFKQGPLCDSLEGWDGVGGGGSRASGCLGTHG